MKKSRTKKKKLTLNDYQEVEDLDDDIKNKLESLSKELLKTSLLEEKNEADFSSNNSTPDFKFDDDMLKYKDLDKDDPKLWEDFEKEIHEK